MTPTPARKTTARPNLELDMSPLAVATRALGMARAFDPMARTAWDRKVRARNIAYWTSRVNVIRAGGA